VPLLSTEGSLLLHTPQQRLDAFQWAGQPPKIVPFRRRLWPRPHLNLIMVPSGSHELLSKPHLYRFSRFAGLMNVTNRQTTLHRI